MRVSIARPIEGLAPGQTAEVSFPIWTVICLFITKFRQIIELTQPPTRWILWTFSVGVKLPELKPNILPSLELYCQDVYTPSNVG
jgi:hypothetical protein